MTTCCDEPAGRRAEAPLDHTGVYPASQWVTGGFAHPLAQGVLQLGLLDEDVVLGRQGRVGRLRALEVEAEPLLHALLAGAGGEVEEQGEVEHERRREDRVAAQEVDLDLHRVAHPPEDVDVVPPLLVVAAGG